MVAPHLDRCLDDESAAWFVGGKGTDTDRERVDAHLDGCAVCRRRIAALALVSPPVTSFVAATEAMDDLLTEPAPPPPAPPRASGTIPALGERIGRYVVLRTLGRGGMGVVVAAHDPELDRQVAIKLVHPTLWRTASREARELLRSEARAMARLVHPNVVTVHDLGTIDDQLFVAMELVAGTSLDQWMKTPRGWREVLAVCIGAGRGIAAAHRAGLVHRDVKPHNVLIDPDGGARIADFGLAMLPRLDTATHSPAGTPAYMSPEQHRCEPVGPESDQFSFCVMVYEALFGERPFGGRTVAEVALEVSEGRVKPPPARSKVPRHVRRALLRGLATDADARWPSMDALLDALAPRPTGRRAATAALGVVAAGAVTFALVASRDPDPDDAARASARDAAASVWNARARAELASTFAATAHAAAPDAAATVTRALDRFVERWIEARVVVARRNRDGSEPVALARRRSDCLGRRLAEARAVVETLRAVDAPMVERAPDAVRLLTPVSVCTEGNALAGRMPPPEDPARRDRFHALEGELDRITAFAHVGKVDEAAEMAARAVEEARAIDHPPLTAEALFVYGGLQGSRNQNGIAQQILEEALVEVARAGDDELAGRIWIRFLGVAASAGEVERCRALAAGASAAIERAQDPELRVWFEDAMGTVENAAGDFAEAERRHRAALALAERIATTDGADRGFLRLHLAGDLVELGRLDEARAELTRGRASAVDELGETNPYLALFDTQSALISQASGDFEGMLAATEELAERPTAATADFVEYLHGTALFGVGRIEEAVAPLRAAADSFREKRDAQREFEARFNLAISLYTLLRHAEAVPEIDRAIDIAELAFAPGDPRLSDARLQRGVLALELGELERAISQCRASLDLFTKAGGEADPQRVIPLVCLARAKRRQGDARAALATIRDAHRLAGKTMDPGLLLETFDELSMDLWATGDKDGARDAVAKAIAAAEASGQDTAELRERLATWKTSRR